MATSTRFITALHLLTVLADRKPAPFRSEDLAICAGTNPAVVRRLLQSLSAAGITKSQLGKGGGAVLARPMKKISLLDVFQAVEARTLVQRKRSDSATRCSVWPRAEPAVAAAVTAAEQAFFKTLAGVSLKQIAKAAKNKSAG